MSERNPRNNRHGRPGGTPVVRAGLLVRLWRWRTEIVLLAAASAVLTAVALSPGRGGWWSFAVLTCAVGVPATFRAGRSWVSAHGWCLISRHRIQRTCEETGIHTRSGRLSPLLWITPSAAGEKALILARAGTCAEDFDAFSAEIASACYARDAVILRHRRWAHLLIIEIIRRDETLGPPLRLDRLYRRANWVSLRTWPSTRTEPDTRFATGLIPDRRQQAA